MSPVSRSRSIRTLSAAFLLLLPGSLGLGCNSDEVLVGLHHRHAHVYLWDHMLCWWRQDEVKDLQRRQHKEYALFVNKGATGKLSNLCVCMWVCACACARARTCHNI